MKRSIHKKVLLIAISAVFVVGAFGFLFFYFGEEVLFSPAPAIQSGQCPSTEFCTCKSVQIRDSNCEVHTRCECAQKQKVIKQPIGRVAYNPGQQSCSSYDLPRVCDFTSADASACCSGNYPICSGSSLCFIDQFDPNCLKMEVGERCGDFIDNDGDGAVDSDDSDCCEQRGCNFAFIENGECRYSYIPGCMACIFATDCDDTDPETENYCVSGRCVFS